MSRIWTIIFGGAWMAGVLQAQPCGSPRCTPTPELFNYEAGLYPNPITPLYACVEGVRTVQFVAPLTLDAGPLGVRRIERIEVVNVTGLPPGVTWDTNNPNNVWTAPNAQTPPTGCFRFCGTPTQVPLPGDSVVITLRGRLEGIPFDPPPITAKIYASVLNYMPAPEPVNGAVLCRNVPQTILFSTGGAYRAGNRLKLELSGPDGDFSAPIALDSVPFVAQGCGLSQAFNVVLPVLPPSSNYRMRVVSTNPVDTSLATVPLTLSDVLTASVSASGPTNFCAGESVVLASDVVAAAYRWEPGGQTTPSITVSQSGAYRLFVRNNAGCESAAEPINVVVRPVPQVNLGPDRNVCGPTTLQLPNVAGGLYRWYADGQIVSGASAFTVQQTGTYVGEITAPNGCVGRDTIVVQVSPIIDVDLGADKSGCGSVTLDLGNNFLGNQFQWRRYGQTAILSNERVLTVTQSGEYIGRVISPCGDADEDTVAVVVYALPPVTLPDVVVGCGTATLETATVFGAQYRWFNAQTGQTLPSNAPTLTVVQSGLYGVRVTDLNGCVNFDTVTVEVLPQLSVNLGPDRSVCNAVTLDAGNNYLGIQYRWTNADQPENILSTARNFIVSQSGTYRVQVFAPCDLTLEDEVTITVYPEPTPDLGPDRPVCGTETLTVFSDIPGATYRWVKTDVPDVILSQNPVYVAQISGTYVATVSTPFGCVRSDTVTLTITVPPAADLGPDATVVACGSTVLDAGFGAYGARYAWFKLPNLGDTLARSKKFTVEQTGTYRVVVTTLGCLDFAIDDVTVFVLPSPNRLPDWDSVRVLCNDNTLYFDIPENLTALWSTGATGGIVSFPETGVYWLDLTAPNGCSRSDSFFVRLDGVNAALDLDYFTCGNAIDITPGNLPPGGNVKWYDASGVLVGEQPTLTAPTPGVYFAQITSRYGCEQRLETNVVAANLSVDLGVREIKVCGGEPVNLNPEVNNPAGLEVNYLWSNGATTPTLNGVPTGVYTVKVYNGYCEAVDTVTVVAGNVVLSNITGNPRPKAGTTSAYSVFRQNNVNYTWTTTGGTIVSGQNTNKIDVQWTQADISLSPITIRVKATDAEGCSAEKSFVVTVSTSVSRDKAVAGSVMTVYPNPAQNEAIVKWDKTPSFVDLKLIDMSGKVLRQHRIDAPTEFRLDLTDLPAGVYVLESGTERVRLSIVR